MEQNFKGNYNNLATYSPGDVVKFANGIWYVMRREAPAGTPPVDTRYWNIAGHELATAAQMALGASSGDYDFSDPKQIVKAIRAGDIDLVPNGTVFKTTHSEFGDLYFVTRAKNQHKVFGDETRPTITIMPLYLLPTSSAATAAKTFVYDRQEAFCKVANAIPAGTVVKFTMIAYSSWAAGDWKFTATAEIAKGSLLCLNSNASTALGSNKVDVYAKATDVSPAASYDISEDDGTATLNLGTFGTELNHPQRVSYGSNNGPESNFQQWLNISGAMASRWQPQTQFDMLASMYTSMNGFLTGFDPEFLQLIARCNVPNISNNVYEAPDSNYQIQKTIYSPAYFFLPSREEIYGTTEDEYEAGETQFDYYRDVATTDADKLMFAQHASAPLTSWLRTPTASFARDVRVCSTGNGGALSSSTAYYSFGAAPLAILA